MKAMDDEGQLTIEELASRAGTATTTVRMYQSKGLLPPPERRGRIGYYGEGHLARLRLIASKPPARRLRSATSMLGLRHPTDQAAHI